MDLPSILSTRSNSAFPADVMMLTHQRVRDVHHDREIKQIPIAEFHLHDAFSVFAQYKTRRNLHCINTPTKPFSFSVWNVSDAVYLFTQKPII